MEFEFSVSILIPVIGFRSVNRTVETILAQNYNNCEILVLRNGIDEENIPGRFNVYELEDYKTERKIEIREVLINQKGKGNALNIGAEYAKNAFLCVLDADCFLGDKALEIAMNNFRDEKIIAVGGKLIALNKNINVWNFLQQIEYERTFNISRNIFNLINANCIISGAFGIFRREYFAAVSGYDTHTVGEDMELSLRLQEKFRPIGKRIVYEETSICYTLVPCTIYRLLKQRDRWQRGLLDCLIKHSNMIINPRYGMLGIVALPYQVIFELFGPILILGQFMTLSLLLSGNNNNEICWCEICLGFETLTTFIALCRESGTIFVSIKAIIKAVVFSLLGSVISIPLAAIRLWGMITFPWRKEEW